MSELTDDEIKRRLAERTSAWDAQPRSEPALDPPNSLPTRGNLLVERESPEWAGTFRPGQIEHIRGWVMRVGGHYVDEKTNEPLGVVFIPIGHTGKFLQRQLRQEREDQIQMRRKSIHSVEKLK